MVFKQLDIPTCHNNATDITAQACQGRTFWQGIWSKHLFFVAGAIMTTELYLLSCTLILAIVQIMLVSILRTRETGGAYNTGPRDEEGPPVGKITGRMQRALKNLYETLPLFMGAVLIVALAGRESTLSFYGAWMYFLARVVYVPLYAAGIPVLRTLTWLISLIGMLLVLAAALLPF